MEAVPMGQLEDIAAEVGVSKWTVSRVLNGGVAYNRPTFARRAQQIREIAARVGYMPNAAARATATGRFASATLVLSAKGSSRSYLPEELLAGIHDGLAEQGMHLNVARLPDEMLTDEAAVPSLLRQWSSDGLLINYIAEIPPGLIERIERHQLPSIWINTQQAADCAHPDDSGGARMGTQRLLELGHRRIAYATFEAGGGNLHYSMHDRRAGFEQTMRDAGLQPQLIGADEQIPPAQRLARARVALQDTDAPTAVLTYNDSDAVTLLSAAHALGLRVPQDLSLLCFAIGGSLVNAMQLAHVYLPEATLGRTAVEMLVRKIANPTLTLPPRAVACGFVTSATLGPAPKRSRKKSITTRSSLAQ